MPSFQHNARKFSDHQSTLLTRTIAPHDPLRCLTDADQALIRFRGEVARLGNGSAIRIVQRIGPNPNDARKVTVHEYSYAFFLGPTIDSEPLVRYEYVPQHAEHDPTYRYPVGHMHIAASVPLYDAYIAPYEKKPFHAIHFPTGRIALEDFIEALIVEFHVPVRGRDPDAAIRFLRRSRDTFRTEKQTRSY